MPWQTPWMNAQVAYPLTVWWATATVENDKVATWESDPSKYDEVVTTKDTETIDAFSSHILHARMGMAHTGEGINMMIQALYAEDGTVQNTYTELCDGSKNVTVVVRNSMVYLQTQRTKSLVARAVTVTWVPEPPMQTSVMGALDEAQDLHMPRLTIKQKQEKLLEELDLSVLESWPPIWYHDIFSLDPSELSCTHSTKHVIKVTDDTKSKKNWGGFPPLVEEVHMHLWEILDSGMIHPNQSVWCNAVVLVWKKDGGLHLCIDFHHLNVHMKKDSYPLPRIQEALESLVGAGHFSCLDLKSAFWQIKMDESSK